MKSKPTFTQTEAEQIVALIKEKLKADPTRQKGIRDKIRKLGFYASDYGFRDGYTVEQFLSVAKMVGDNKINGSPKPDQTPTINPFVKTFPSPAAFPTSTPIKSRSQSDENYVIDLFDKVLQQKALRQHHFDFLLGDSGTRLPVDAYYPALNLVIEFREKQHTEEVKFFDRRQTASGIDRGEQRKLYDQRRREVLPKHWIKLIEIGYEDFKHHNSKKLLRNRKNDVQVIVKLLTT